MTAYYNEIDPYAAQWLRNLIEAGHIAPGDVDTRSIIDVHPSELSGYEQCHFFAGIGGWSYALRLAGWADDRAVWTGSCPCQPFSLAGAQKGFDDTRHLWPEFKRLIAQRSPPVIFGEQVASATEWLRLVRGDLEALGYAVGAIPIEAASAGADHLRDRYWFVADTGPQRSETGGSGSIPRQEGIAGIFDDRRGEIRVAGAEEQRFSAGTCFASGRSETIKFERQGDGVNVGHSVGTRAGWDGGNGRCAEAPSSGEGRSDGRRGNASQSSGSAFDWVIGADGKARRVKSGIRLLAHGIPARVGKLRGFGNAIDPRPAREFIGAYMNHSRAAVGVPSGDK